MAKILETVMLICFGISWPINLIKNVKARSAKGMSLMFIVMIIIGYIAGITAKIVGNQINYVLIAYVVNLLMVSANLVVYFINKKIDEGKK
jgi:hypothetical protein